MKTYTLEELRLAKAKGCRIEMQKKVDGTWMPLFQHLDFVTSIKRLRIHPADEWKDRLPRLRDGAEWHRNDFTNEMLEGGFRPHLLGETGEGEYLSNGKWKQDGPSTSHLRTTKHCQHTRTRRPVPPEFLHPDELTKQPEAAVPADLMAMAQFTEREVLGAQAPDFGEPWQPSCEIIFDRDGDYVAEFQPPFHDSSKVAARAIACTNALTGVANPAEFVRQAKEMREAIRAVKTAIEDVDRRGREFKEGDCPFVLSAYLQAIASSALVKLKPFLP